MADVNDEEIQIETPLTIGERLRRAREAKQLSIPEVSSQIRLVRDNIESIEAGQWGELHGRAYARGYLISYVKFLGLAEEEFIAAFNREYETYAPEVPLSNNVARLMENKSLPWFKTLLIVLLAGVAWSAYQQWLQYELDLAAEMTSSVERVETNSFSSSVVEPILATEEISDENINNKEMPVIEQTVDATPEIIAEPTETVEVAVITESTPAAAHTITETSIELGFSEDCWVNVTDASGKVLLNKVMNANTNIELSGQAPLSLSLGRASAVTMKVNGADFDLVPHTRSDVAKFSLGVES